MFRRQPTERTPASKPKGYPDGSTPRRPVQRLRLLLPTFDGRAGRGADGAWWRDGKSQRLSCLFPESPDVSRGRGTLRALLLPPLLPSSSTRKARARGNQQPADRDNPDALGTLLGELLPNKFRHFLHQLRAKCAEPEADREAAGVGWGAESLGSQARTRSISMVSPPAFPFLPPPSTLSATVPQQTIRALPRALPSFSVFQQLFPPRLLGSTIALGR